MSDPAARPWWADVQHLRPREERDGVAVAPRGDRATGRDAGAGATPSTPTGRFRRDAGAGTAAQRGALATLEHEGPDPFARADPWSSLDPARTSSWAPAEASAPWDADGMTFAGLDAEPAVGDDTARRTPIWDEGLEQAFASAPSWADDDWLAPKHAERIENGRRTIEIRGQVDRVVGVTAPAETGAATRTGRRRPARRPAERLAGRPDRVAMWAFVLGVLLIVVAALSQPSDAGAATLAAHHAPAAHVVVAAPAAP